MIDKFWHIVERILFFILYKLFRLKLSDKAYLAIVQFVKFGVVGIINNFICYFTYIFLLRLGMHYVPANILGFTVSVFNAYYWNNKYVFLTDDSRVWWKALLKTYISYAGTGIVLNNLLLVLWIEMFEVSTFIAPLLNLMLTVPINYLVNRFWAFSSDKNK